MLKTLVDCIRHHAEKRPEKVYWRHVRGADSTEITFGGLHKRATSFAHAYEHAGVVPGEVVLIFLPHHADAPAAFFGAMLIGAVPSFMPCPSAKQHPSIYWPAHLSLLQRIKARVLLTDAIHARQMAEHGLAAAVKQILTVEDVENDHGALPSIDVGEDSVALLQHSSGTTALKKGVALSHRAIIRQVEAYSARLGMGEADNIVSWLPLYHDMGLIACTVTPLVLGQTVTCLDPFQWVARPTLLLDSIERYNGHFTWLPNFAFEHLARTAPEVYAVDLSGMKAFIDCSEPCKPETFGRFHQRFASMGVRKEQLQVCYAMAETVFGVSQTEVGREPKVIEVDVGRLQGDRVAADPAAGGKGVRIMSTGRPLAGIEVRIRDDGKDLPDNIVGEVVLSGEYLFSGYFNDKDTTAERLSDGWYSSRDLGFMRDGELYVLGRKDDLIIVNGRNLYAHEVEAVVASVGGLKAGRVVAFGVFNEGIGSEELVVVAERAEGQDAARDQSVSRMVRDVIYDRTNIEVKSCRIVDAGWLIKTTSGKISRESNRAKFLGQSDAGRASSDQAAAVERTTLQRLGEIIHGQFKYPAEKVGRETVAGDVDGWDSLAHATLIVTIEKTFRIRFADDEMFSFPNVGRLADRVDELLATGGKAEIADRIIYESELGSIVRLGKEADGPEIICFAGAHKKFGGLNLLDFSSTFLETSARETSKYFVTDRMRDWYTTAFDELVEKLNAVSDKPKILVGNSMGGYGALLFANALTNVKAVLSFVPQHTPKVKRMTAHDRPLDFWKLRLRPDIPCCILYGQVEDVLHKKHLEGQLGPTHRLVMVPNCGHNVVRYLNKKGILAQVLDCCMRPETMGEEISRIVSTIPPDPKTLQARINAKKKRRAKAARRRQRREIETVAA